MMAALKALFFFNLVAVSIGGIFPDNPVTAQQGAYKDEIRCHGDCSSGTVTYDSLTTDISTDNSMLDIHTGVYTVTTPGLYMVSLSATINWGSLSMYVDGSSYGTEQSRME